MLKRFPLLFAGLFLNAACNATGAASRTPHAQLRDEAPAAVSPAARFERLIASIEQHLRATVGDAAAAGEIQALAQSGVRNDLFQIQNLAELYVQRFPVVRQIQTDTKAFEDQVGAFRAAKEKVDFAIANQAPAATIASLQSALAQEETTTISFLTDSHWNLSDPANKIVTMRAMLAAIQWDPTGQDRQYLFGALCGQVMDVDNKTWNMFDLTAPLGLHNLKKALRWHRVEVALLTGDLVDVGDDGCANDQLLEDFDKVINDGGLVADICKRDTSLANLNNVTERGTCNLSRCYQGKVDALYDLLSAIKDEAEGLEAIGQHISQARLQQADDAYRDSKTTKILRKLSYELKSCLNKQN